MKWAMLKVSGGRVKEGFWFEWLKQYWMENAVKACDSWTIAISFEQILSCRIAHCNKNVHAFQTFLHSSIQRLPPVARLEPIHKAIRRSIPILEKQVIAEPPCLIISTTGNTLAGFWFGRSFAWEKKETAYQDQWSNKLWAIAFVWNASQIYPTAGPRNCQTGGSWVTKFVQYCYANLDKNNNS